MDIVLLLLGIGVLVAGGEFLVRGAVEFSHSLKISPLVVGMTIVAFGTSAPELLVSLTSSLNGNPGIAIGNVVGSNIANIALVLGITVLIFPIVADKHAKNIDFPMMIVSTLLLFFFIRDGELSFMEGAIFFTMVVLFTFAIIRNSRRKMKKQEAKTLEDERKKMPYWKSLLFLHLGFVGLFFGAAWFIQGAVGLADTFLADNPEKDVIIGVTVVAFGTSAPELVASCVAAYKKETDMAVGNLIGSNIFNILVVLGITSMVKPIPVTKEIIEFDMIWVIGVAFLLMFVLAVGKKIGKIKGAILVSTYIAYITIIVLRVKGII
ncbi:MAG: calcium/sodium antiporter [Crocinitomicaceae bacterium]|nr:calcium/sodium antiporter [Crocinitomicaceae bacterium]